jgi:hypothetical protein
MEGERLKKSYSSLNLLKERLSGFSDTKGLFSYLFTNKKYLTVSMPYYDFIRGKVFIGDLRDNFDDVPLQFSLNDLIFLLYDDFLTQIKKGAKNEQIAHYLIIGQKTHFQKTKIEKRVMKHITKNLLEFETIEVEEQEEVEEIQREDRKTAYLTIRMRQSEVLRAEVLIHDLEPFLKGTEISVEQVISIIYLDFIEKVKSEGNSLKVQKSILSYIKQF